MNNTKTNYTVMSQKEINSYRHKSERRWYRALIIMNFLVIFVVACACFANMDDNKKYFAKLKNDFNAVQVEVMAGASMASEESEQVSNSEENVNKNTSVKNISSINTNLAEDDEDEETAADKLGKRIDKFPYELKLFILMMLGLVTVPIIASLVYAEFRSMSVKVTENNFPEIYETVKEFTQKLGLKKMPNVYIVQANGVLNAMSSFIPFKQYIELNADLVEVAYREHKDMDAIRFIIGHEMAHIRLKHATMHYHMLIAFSRGIPIIGSTASRAREYSCDRIAQQISGSDGIDAMMSLTAGIHLYKKVNKEDYIENAKRIHGFFAWCYNLLIDHPAMNKRIIALSMKEENGKLY